MALQGRCKNCKTVFDWTPNDEETMQGYSPGAASDAEYGRLCHLNDIAMRHCRCIYCDRPLTRTSVMCKDERFKCKPEDVVV